MNHLNKSFLNICILKYRKLQYTQSQLCEGICSKYTLSRLENGHHAKSKIYDQLIHRLGYTYTDPAVIIDIYTILQDTLLQMEYDQRDQIIKNIEKMKALLQPNSLDIYLHEIAFYISLMEQHYIHQQCIAFKLDEYMTLPYLPQKMYIAFMHTICENLLFNNQVENFISFIEKYQKNLPNILLDYHVMTYYQFQNFIVDSDTIFKQHKTNLLEINHFFQYFRYATVDSIGYIGCDINHAIKLFNSLYKLSKKLTIHPYYKCVLYNAFIDIYILLHQYEKAIYYIDEASMLFKEQRFFFTPYAVFLYLHTNQTLPPHYMIESESTLCNNCITYYHLRHQKPKESILINYLTKYIVPYCSRYTTKAPFPTLVNNEVMRVMEKGRCYQSAINFDIAFKKTCR